MQVAVVSNAGFSAVSNTIQRSLADASQAAAVQRARSVEAASRRADDAATQAEQQRNRQTLDADQNQPSNRVTSGHRVDLYL